MRSILAAAAFAALSFGTMSTSFAALAQERVVTPAVARNVVQICNDNWPQCPEADRLQIASSFCRDMTVDDMKLNGIHLGDQNNFRTKVREHCLTQSSSTPLPPADDVSQEQPPTQIAQQMPRGGRPALSGAENAQLNNLLARRAIQVMGPAPTNRHSFKGTRARVEPAPRGCRQVTQRAQGGTFVRVICGGA